MIGRNNEMAEGKGVPALEKGASPGDPDRAAGAEGKLEPLIVWCADPEIARPLLTGLGQVFTLEMRDDLPDPGSIKADPAAPAMLLMFFSATTALCRSMNEGLAPRAALKDWHRQALALSAVNRRNRRRVRILDIAQALDHPQAFRRQFGLKGETQLTAGSRAFAAGDAVLGLLARTCLAGDEKARMLARELEAASLDLGSREPPEDPDAAFDAYRDLLLGSRGESRLSRAQTTLIREESEAELASLRAKLINTERQLEDQQRRGSELAEYLERMENSRSWRVTAPLRRTRAILSGRGGE